MRGHAVNVPGIPAGLQMLLQGVVLGRTRTWLSVRTRFTNAQQNQKENDTAAREDRVSSKHGMCLAHSTVVNSRPLVLSRRMVQRQLLWAVRGIPFQD